MQHPGGGPDADSASVQDDLTDLLAPADVQFHPAPPAARPRRAPPPVPVTRTGDEDATGADLTRRRTAPAPAGAPAPAAAPPTADAQVHAPAARPAAPAAAAPVVRPPARVAPHDAEDVVTFGRWFQPVPGGVLPRPDPGEPVVAVVRAGAGSTIHAVTAGRVRRSPATLAAGGIELAAPDGTTLVVTAPAGTAWVRDDEDVAAGEVVGVLPTDGPDAGDTELHVLVIGPDGAPRDAVDLLVGLPDPGELDLGPGLGTDPFALDLEIAGRPDVRGAR